MNNNIINVGIVLAGGIGSRFEGDKPKQYYTILGKEMIWYTIDAFMNSKTIDDFIVIVDENEYKNGRVRDTYGVKTVQGGKTRNWSFKNALEFIHANYPCCAKIIENNAACPMITSYLIDEFIRILDEYDFVNTAYKITDALGSYKDRIANREEFYLIQAPDAYKFDLIYHYFNPESTLCHPAHQLPIEAKEFRYFNYLDNYKVTYPSDLPIVEYLLKKRKNTLITLEDL